MNKETICSVCKAIVRLRRTGLITEHHVNGIICRGSGKRPESEGE